MAQGLLGTTLPVLLKPGTLTTVPSDDVPLPAGHWLGFIFRIAIKGANAGTTFYLRPGEKYDTTGGGGTAKSTYSQLVILSLYRRNKALQPLIPFWFWNKYNDLKGGYPENSDGALATSTIYYSCLVPVGFDGDDNALFVRDSQECRIHLDLPSITLTDITNITWECYGIPAPSSSFQKYEFICEQQPVTTTAGQTFPQIVQGNNVGAAYMYTAATDITNPGDWLRSSDAVINQINASIDGREVSQVTDDVMRIVTNLFNQVESNTSGLKEFALGTRIVDGVNLNTKITYTFAASLANLSTNVICNIFKRTFDAQLTADSQAYQAAAAAQQIANVGAVLPDVLTIAKAASIRVVNS